MAKATATAQRAITLTIVLTANESKRLMAMVQNPVVTDEDPIERHLREEIFKSLEAADVHPY